MHRIHIPDWAVARGKALNHFNAVDPERTALIVIDMQNAFMVQGQVFGNPYAQAIVANVNRLATAVRAHGAWIVWTRQTVTTQGEFAYPSWQLSDSVPQAKAAMEALSDGSYGHSLHADMDVRPEDTIVNKHRYSALIAQSSCLGENLRARGIDSLIIAGTLTNCCCESTARDAYMLGYKVFFLSDATAAVTDEEHNAALLNLRILFADVRTTDEMLALIDAEAPR